MRRHAPWTVASLGTALLVLGGGCRGEDPAPANDDPPSASQPTEPSPSAAVPPDLEAFRPVVGKTPAEAEQWLKANPTPSPEHPDMPVVLVRPVKVDGEELPRTMDLRNDRLNVVVEQGTITGIDGVY